MRTVLLISGLLLAAATPLAPSPVTGVQGLGQLDFPLLWLFAAAVFSVALAAYVAFRLVVGEMSTEKPAPAFVIRSARPRPSVVANRGRQPVTMRQSRRDNPWRR